MLWTVQSFPRCTHHVFLSHSAEDRAGLAYPLYAELVRRGVATWLDRHDYPYGLTSRAALRDAVLRSRHAVVLVTPAMLSQARGWCVQELAWAELLQDNLHGPGGDWVNVLLPLYFVPQADPRLPRSVWQVGRDRGEFWPGRVPRVRWAADRVERFLRREQGRAADYDRAVADGGLPAAQLRPGTGLPERATRFDPQPLPPRPPGSPPAPAA